MTYLEAVKELKGRLRFERDSNPAYLYGVTEGHKTKNEELLEICLEVMLEKVKGDN